MINIFRKGCHRSERTVEVYDCETGISNHVNPQAEIQKAAGTFVSRNYCVVDFAQGLVFAGRTVQMCENFVTRPKRQYIVRKKDRVTLIYFLLGFVWGRNYWFWQRMKNTLGVLKASPDFKLKILEETGKFYLDNPYDRGDLTLKVPLLVSFPNFS